MEKYFNGAPIESRFFKRSINKRIGVPKSAVSVCMCVRAHACMCGCVRVCLMGEEGCYKSPQIFTL